MPKSWQSVNQQKVDSFNSSIAEYELTRKAIDSDRQLALDCAQKVSELKEERDQEQTYLDQFQQSEKQLAQNIQQAKANLRRLTRSGYGKIHLKRSFV